MRKTIATLTAGAVILGGAAIAAAQDDAADDQAPPAVEWAHPRGDALEDVLDELVGNGTITQAQSDAISEALDARRDEMRALREERRAEMEALRDRMQSFLEDGVLTADELAQFPEGHPLVDPDGPAAEYLGDGQLTEDELAELRESFGPRRGHGFGHHGRGFGPGSVPSDTVGEA